MDCRRRCLESCDGRDAVATAGETPALQGAVLINKNGAKNWVGQALPRKEENRLLRGRGKFADDIKLREMLYLRFVRSPYAHAKIVSVDVSAAEALAGVVGTLTGAEIAAQTQPFIEIGPDPCSR